MTEAAYRTADESILAAYHDLAARSAAYVNAVADFMQEEGLADYEILTWESTAFAGLKLKHPPEKAGSGWAVYWSEEAPPPGWRSDSKHRCYTPDRRTKEGKRVQARIDELRGQLPGSLLSIIRGMPLRCFGAPGHTFTPGVRMIGDMVYVHWGTDPEMVSEWDGGRNAGPIDKGIWQRIPLPEYYAALEADDKAGKGAPGE